MTVMPSTWATRAAATEIAIGGISVVRIGSAIGADGLSLESGPL
jgi:hypothetical protein